MAIYIGNAENKLTKVCSATAIGPKGDKGDPGPAGPQGPKGDKGDPGAVATVNGKMPDRQGNIVIDASDIDLETTSTLLSADVQSAIDELDEKVNAKQDALTAGDNITIEDNVISASGGGTSDHTQLTNRDAADQHPVSSISGSGSSSANARTSDLYMGSHAIHNVADANPENNMDAVNVKFLREHIPQANGNAIGGIKAAAKTASDTVPVHVDAGTGFAYVASGGSGTPEIYWAVYGETTSAELKTEYLAGKLIFCRYNTFEYELTKVNNEENPGSFTFICPFLPDADRLLCTAGGWIEVAVSVELSNNKVTSLSAASTDTQYPSAKCVYDAINTAIGDTASALSALDNLIGGGTE